MIERERRLGEGQQAGIFKVGLSLGETGRGVRQRYREIERHRDRADNKNPSKAG